MLTLILIFVVIFAIFHVIFRLLIRPIWNPYGIRRPYFGPYGYYGYGRGYRRRHFPGGLLAILALVAFDRIIGRRW